MSAGGGYVRASAWMLAFPMLVLVSAYVLAFDRGTTIMLEAGVVMLTVGAVGTVLLMLLTGVWELLRGVARGDYSGDLA